MPPTVQPASPHNDGKCIRKGDFKKKKMQTKGGTSLHHAETDVLPLFTGAHAHSSRTCHTRTHIRPQQCHTTPHTKHATHIKHTTPRTSEVQRRVSPRTPTDAYVVLSHPTRMLHHICHQLSVQLAHQLVRQSFCTFLFFLFINLVKSRAKTTPGMENKQKIFVL